MIDYNQTNGLLKYFSRKDAELLISELIEVRKVMDNKKEFLHYCISKVQKKVVCQGCARAIGCHLYDTINKNCQG